MAARSVGMQLHSPRSSVYLVMINNNNNNTITLNLYAALCDLSRSLKALARSLTPRI